MRNISVALTTALLLLAGLLTQRPEPLSALVSMQADSATVSLTWDAPGDTDLAQYETAAFTTTGIVHRPWTGTGSLATSASFKLPRNPTAYSTQACVRAVDLAGLTGPETCVPITIDATDAPPGAVGNLVATVSN